MTLEATLKSKWFLAIYFFCFLLQYTLLSYFTFFWSNAETVALVDKILMEFMKYEVKTHWQNLCIVLFKSKDFTSWKYML